MSIYPYGAFTDCRVLRCDKNLIRLQLEDGQIYTAKAIDDCSNVGRVTAIFDGNQAYCFGGKTAQLTNKKNTEIYHSRPEEPVTPEPPEEPSLGQPKVLFWSDGKLWIGGDREQPLEVAEIAQKPTFADVITNSFSPEDWVVIYRDGNELVYVYSDREPMRFSESQGVYTYRGGGFASRRVFGDEVISGDTDSGNWTSTRTDRYDTISPIAGLQSITHVSTYESFLSDAGETPVRRTTGFSEVVTRVIFTAPGLFINTWFTSQTVSFFILPGGTGGEDFKCENREWNYEILYRGDNEAFLVSNDSMSAIINQIYIGQTEADPEVCGLSAPIFELNTFRLIQNNSVGAVLNFTQDWTQKIPFIGFNKGFIRYFNTDFLPELKGIGKHSITTELHNLKGGELEEFWEVFRLPEDADILSVALPPYEDVLE